MEEVEKKLLSTLLEGLPPPENQLNLDFFEDDNDISKKMQKQNTVTRR